MELIHGRFLFLFILFLSFSFFVRATIDCGGNQIVHTIVVDQNGKGDFRTVQAAIDSIKENNDRWIKVHVNAGTYREKVRISPYKPCIFLEGAGKEFTKIASSGSYIQDARSFDATTFISSPPNVLVVGINFENTFNLEGSGRILRAPSAAIYGEKSVFYKCGFVSFQDTLFDAKGRHYFKNCYIQGEVDFIYGGAQSYYEGCAINATYGKRSLAGYITAQSRGSENDTSGFVFKGCSINGSGKVNLGRAWGPYSRVIFYESYLSSVVTPQGWYAWHFSGQASKLTYAEVNCSGPGANSKKRVKWEKHLNPSQLEEFSLSSFINKDGWLSNLPLHLL